MYHAQQHGVYHVVHVAPGPDLAAIAVDLQRFIPQSPLDELMDRSFAHLSWTINIEGPNNRGGQPFLLVVGDRQVFFCQLAYGIGPTGLAHRSGNGLMVLGGPKRLLAEDFTCGEAHHSVASRQLRSGLEDIGRTDHIHSHCERRALDHCVDARNSRAVDHNVSPLHRACQMLGVQDVAFDQRQVLVIGVRLVFQRVARQVVVGNNTVVID